MDSLEDKSFYRTHRKKIVALANDFERPKKQDELFDGFFGMKPEDLTQEERDNFTLFVSYAQKRLINVKYHDQNILSESGFLNTFDSTGSLSLHDLGHVIATVED